MRKQICKPRYWLVTIRSEKGLSRADVSRQTGIPDSNIAAIEGGFIKEPRVHIAKRIAKVLGFDWTRFYEEEDAE